MRQEPISILKRYKSELPDEFSSNQAIGVIKDHIKNSKEVPSNKQIGKILNRSKFLGSRIFIKGKNKLIYFFL